MIEMIYHLQLNAALGPDAAASSASTLDAPARRSWLGAGRRCWRRRRRCSNVARRRFARDWGRVQEEIENEIKRQGGGMSGPAPAHSSSRTCARASARPRSSAASTCAVHAGRARRDHRPQRRRQVDAVQPDQRPLRAHQRRGPAQRQAHRRPEAVRDQPAGPVAQLPDHQHLPPACRCSRTCAAACCGRWATATRSGSSSPTCDDANERAEELHGA